MLIGLFVLTWIFSSSCGQKRNSPLENEKNKTPSFPQASGGEVVHGCTVYAAKDANPVNNLSHPFKNE
ncbi:MAG: hypothetical protein ACI9SC_002415 [Gammaproteobacteria bacterium]|jgi:hypothetical protein